MNVPERKFIHADLDAFFASVEQLDNPQLRGKPVVVGGFPSERRSVVSTASYEARKFGIHSAMPSAAACRLCPEALFIHPRMARYEELSEKIMGIFREFSPEVDQMSIDEAFINLTGTEELFGPAEKTALAIKSKVLEETGLTVSVGLAGTKYLAKLASGISKPDGFHSIPSGGGEEFMMSLPLEKVWGIGPKTLDRLHRAGFLTTKKIRDTDLSTLKFLFGGSMGEFLYGAVRGGDTGKFRARPKTRSISAETTFPFDLTDTYTAETSIMELAHTVMFRLLRGNMFSRTISLKIRYDDFSSVSAQETYSRNFMTLDSFFSAEKSLFERKYEKGRGIRLLGVGFDNITETEDPYQQELFDDGTQKRQAVERAILGLEKNHPGIRIRKARTLRPDECGKP